eukprot:scaffold94744_cov68-Phaeocystis_antarctica.AAC.8
MVTADQMTKLRQAARGALPARLAAVLAQNHTRVLDLFRAADSDGDGEISHSELSRLLRKLGVECSQSELAQLFETLDPDRSGGIDYRELQQALHDAAPQSHPRPTNGAPSSPSKQSGTSKGGLSASRPEEPPTLHQGPPTAAELRILEEMINEAAAVMARRAGAQRIRGRAAAARPRPGRGHTLLPPRAPDVAPAAAGLARQARRHARLRGACARAVATEGLGLEALDPSGRWRLQGEHEHARQPHDGAASGAAWEPARARSASRPRHEPELEPARLREDPPAERAGDAHRHAGLRRAVACDALASQAPPRGAPLRPDKNDAGGGGGLLALPPERQHVPSVARARLRERQRAEGLPGGARPLGECRLALGEAPVSAVPRGMGELGGLPAPDDARVRGPRRPQLDEAALVRLPCRLPSAQPRQEESHRGARALGPAAGHRDLCWVAQPLPHGEVGALALQQRLRAPPVDGAEGRLARLARQERAGCRVPAQGLYARLQPQRRRAPGHVRGVARAHGDGRPPPPSGHRHGAAHAAAPPARRVARVRRPSQVGSAQGQASAGPDDERQAGSGLPQLARHSPADRQRQGDDAASAGPDDERQAGGGLPQLARHGPADRQRQGDDAALPAPLHAALGRGGAAHVAGRRRGVLPTAGGGAQGAAAHDERARLRGAQRVAGGRAQAQVPHEHRPAHQRRQAHDAAERRHEPVARRGR